MSESTTTNLQNNPGGPPVPLVKVELNSHHDSLDDTSIETTELVEVPMASSDTTVTITSDPLPEENEESLLSTTPEESTENPPATSNTASRQVVVQQPQQIQVQQQKFQDVRVDNWGNYCLQRLQLMYDRGDFCDLTMQFHTNQLLKVHRVVVNLCTEYFGNLERLFGLTNGILVLPKDVDYQAMVTIIKFFYTGKLEIRGNQFNEVYRTVKLMNITILIKLLEAHAKKPPPQAKKETNQPIRFKQTVDIGRPLQKGHTNMSGTPMSYSGPTSLSIQGAGGTKTLQVTTPGAKLPPGVKTKTVLARVQSQSVRMAHQNSNKNVTQKKLPIWKERKFNPASANDPHMMEKWPVKDEPARPTRFEWGDPDDDPTFMSPVVSHTLMDKQKLSSTTSRKVEDIFDAVKNQNLGKRSLLSMHSQDNSRQHLKVQQPPLKLMKLEQGIGEKTGPTSHMHSESDHVNLTDETVEEEVSTTEVEMQHVEKKLTSVLKPAIKSQSQNFRPTPMVGNNDPNLGSLGDLGKSQETPTTSGATKLSMTQSKTVRFAPDIEKENSTNKNDETHTFHTNEDLASSHSKIIAEVLKKYPDLVKDKQNIKLKIVQKGTDSSTSKGDKSKVSYIVLKSTSSPESLGAVLLKKPSSQTTTNKGFWDSEKVEKKPSGAENTTGPWLCGPCGGGDETPMEFESYYVYRRHLVDTHGERIDARICEYCGVKASKRNLLLHHLYTKHNVPPPKNMHFPSCDLCDYIALSESLLNKHKLTHDAAKEFSCHICYASFKSSSALQGHMTANLHRNKETKVYECPYCRKPFVRNINLKGHIRALHKDIARIEEMDDPRLQQDETLVNRSVAIANTSRKRQFPSILGGTRALPLEIMPGDGQQVSLVTADGHTIEILHGLDPNTMSVPMTLVPSSEDAMTNVATSIAASLGLETQSVHGGAEFMTGVTSDGSPAVYIMDNSQPAVEVDMSAMGLSADGTMIYDGEDPTGQGQFIVQDIHGNQFRKMTGIDENGKQVIFFQLSEENGQMMGPTMLEDGMQGNGTVFVSSGMPVSVSSSDQVTSQQSQIIMTTSGHDGTMYDLVQASQGVESHDQVVISESDLTEHQVEIDHEQQYHHHREEEIHGTQMHENVQELHIVLDPNENGQEEVEVGDEGQVVQHEDETLMTQHEEHISESYIENVECSEHGEMTETIISTESEQEEGHQEEIGHLEVQAGELEQTEENIMIVEEASTDCHTQDLEIQETEECHTEKADTQQVQIHNSEQEETQDLEIQDDSTQIVVEHHEGEELHLVSGEDEEEELQTQVIDEEEMQLVEEVAGEEETQALDMTEEELTQVVTQDDENNEHEPMQS